MNGDQILERLGLQRERLVAAAAATENYAFRIQEEHADAGEEFNTTGSGRALLSASAFTAAGSFWSLVDAGRGATMFNQAASRRPQESSGWSLVLAICGAPRKPRFGFDWDFERPVLEHPQPEALLLSQLWPVAAGAIDAGEIGRPLDLLTTRGRDVEAVPIGRLRVPLHHYLELGWGIWNARRSHERADDDGVERFRAAAVTFLTRAGEATRAARADTYHWRRLRSGLLPIEPEALAASMLVAMTWQDTIGGPATDTLVESLRGADLVPLLVAEQILAATGEGEAMLT